MESKSILLLDMHLVNVVLGRDGRRAVLAFKHTMLQLDSKPFRHRPHLVLDVILHPTSYTQPLPDLTIPEIQVARK